VDLVRQASSLAREAWDVPPAGDLADGWSDRTRVVCAIVDGEVIGVTTATIVRDGVATSDETVVAPAWRGRGVAARLLDEMMTRLEREGVVRVIGESSASRPNELAFLRDYGFEVVRWARARDRPGFADGTMVAITVLRLPLDRSRRENSPPMYASPDTGRAADPP
jgi:GNAT superfamily N-acetyltransferase